MKTPTKEELRLTNLPEFERKMREAAALVSSIVGLVAAKVAPGVTLNDLEAEAGKLCREFNVKPYNLGYKPYWAKTAYPAILCTSVNDTIAHGIPSDYALKEGDIINIDTGIVVNGVCGDCAITVPVGQIERRHENLLRYAKNACYAGIKKIKAGVSVSEIAQSVESYANKYNFVTNQVFAGHDIGEEMHQKIVIPFFRSLHPDYRKKFDSVILEAGQVVCIEPMLTRKEKKGVLMSDGWTMITGDGNYSAMFEHMVLVKEDGYEVITDHFIKA